MIKNINKIEPKQFTKSDEEILRNNLSNYCKRNKLFACTTQYVNMDFRAFLLKGSETDLLLVNPKIVKKGEEIINSQETSLYDNNYKKVRIVPRYLRVEVQTDNLGLVIFEGDLEDRKEQLTESIFAQQMIDLLDGIVISEKNINKPIERKEKYNRNDLVLAKSPDGLIEQIKYKNVESLLSKGYSIL